MVCSAGWRKKLRIRRPRKSRSELLCFNPNAIMKLSPSCLCKSGIQRKKPAQKWRPPKGMPNLWAGLWCNYSSEADVANSTTALFTNRSTAKFTTKLAWLTTEHAIIWFSTSIRPSILLITGYDCPLLVRERHRWLDGRLHWSGIFQADKDPR